MRCGAAKRPKSAAAPATVSGGPEHQRHWEHPGKAARAPDPRGRRAAVVTIAGPGGVPRTASVDPMRTHGGASLRAEHTRVASTDGILATVYVCITCRR